MKHAAASTSGTHTMAGKPRAAASGKKAPAAAQAGEPADTSREARIREAAYARFQARGGTHGHDVQDWVEAEAALAAATPSAS
jgi:CelD/BcsL family acetyltransferase involved in cellulose biosynthesis